MVKTVTDAGETARQEPNHGIATDAQVSVAVPKYFRPAIISIKHYNYQTSYGESGGGYSLREKTEKL